MANQRPRLASLDALRGFDMFWIVGGKALVVALGAATGWGWMKGFGDQMKHGVWEGAEHSFTAYDLIFPLFLFISCVTLPFSLGHRTEWGESPWTQYAKVAKRVLLLVFLGAVYNFLSAVYNGHLKFEWDELRYASVLGRIGIAWGVVAILVMRLDVRGQALALVGVIAGYWALLRFGHAPDFEPGDLTIKGNVVSHFDRLFLPGKLHQSDLHDPEGLLSTIGAVGTGLIGALAGWWLKGHKQNGGVKAAGLFIAGALATGAGLIWASMGDLPLNKNLWTSSFVLLTGGLSLALLGLFYLLIDVWRLKPLFFFFTVIGMNSITIYLLEGCCPPIFEESAADYQRVLMTTAVITIEWLLLFFLYRKKVFLRV